MAVKADNNTASPNRLVLTLLVYGAYLRISKLDVTEPYRRYYGGFCQWARYIAARDNN